MAARSVKERVRHTKDDPSPPKKVQQSEKITALI